MSAVKLIHSTPDGDALVAYMARVSNPENQCNPESAGLIKYLIKHKHWSPFEMVGACVEINTTRDIARQILRHRSFHFQEFSQRYADASQLGDMVDRECRMQDTKNRQNSLDTDDNNLMSEFDSAQRIVWGTAALLYQRALSQASPKNKPALYCPKD